MSIISLNLFISPVMHRKKFVRSFGWATLGLATWPQLAGAHPLSQEKPQLDKKLVQEFVGAGHRDMEKVRNLLAEHSTLLNAAHDWEQGDFETALGAASHVGYKELASFLLEQGAQANIFTACLFGKIEIVKPMLEAFPSTLHAKGPHGFTLLHHAQRGGDEAMEVKELLEAMGAKETKIPLY